MDATSLTAEALASDRALGTFFLHRLASLVALHRVAPLKERAVLATAAFSVFLDCLDLGLEEPARAILHRLDAEDAVLVA